MSDATGAREIADDLARRIAEGEWQPGDRFPSRVQLRQEYTSSSATIDFAVRRLIEAGLVIPGRGRQGSVVAPPVPAMSQRRHRFADHQGELRGHFADWPGQNPEVEVQRIEPVELSPEMAAHVGEDHALLRHRRYLVDGVPVQVATSWVPLSVAEPIGRLWVADSGAGGMYQRFRDAGYGPLTLLEEITGRPATRVEADQFGLPLSAMRLVHEVWRTVGAASGQTLEVALILMRQDRYRLIYEGSIG